jgi:hypothetical protein
MLPQHVVLAKIMRELSEYPHALQGFYAESKRARLTLR